MKKKKLLPLLVISILFIGIIGGGLAYPSRMDTFTGASHSGCHGFSTVSSTGSITLTSNQGTHLTPGQGFNLTAEISSFTEAITTDRGSECTIAVSPVRGDNGDFASPLSDPIRYSEITLDGTGASGVVSFILLAPTTVGTYVLVVDAINAINHTADSSLPIIFASANITITVGAAVVDGIPGYNIFIVISVSLLAAVPIVLVVRNKKIRKQ